MKPRTYKIGVLAQKGGVGKSSIARTIATEFAREDWSVKLADFDPVQGTAVNWAARRQANGIQPEVQAETFTSVTKAINTSASYNLLVFDGAGQAGTTSRDIAKKCDLIVIPTGEGKDEEGPLLMMAKELAKQIGDYRRVLIVLSRAIESNSPLAKKTFARLEAEGYPISTNGFREMKAYKYAANDGKAMTEVPYPSLRKEAERAVQDISDYFNSLRQEGS